MAKWVCFNSAVFRVGVVPCVSQAESPKETETEEKGKEGVQSYRKE